MNLKRNMKRILGFLLASSAFVLSAQADEIHVAVAANFTAPMKKIAQSFEQETGHKVLLSFGATGSFYAQIKNGAPFEILLAADDQTPEKMEKEDLAVAGSHFTYATGRLVLWSKTPGLVDDKGAVLKGGKFERLAIANPKLAPYGAAAVETMTMMGVLQDLQSRLVQGESIGQTYQFVASENAQLGFVALSQVYSEGKFASGSVWVVPTSLHAPLRQDAVLLKKGQGNAPAVSLLNYLRSEKAKAVILSYGYEF